MMQLRIYDFVVDRDENANFPVAKPHLYRTTVAHSGTVLFDPEVQTGCSVQALNSWHLK